MQRGRSVEGRRWSARRVRRIAVVAALAGCGAEQPSEPTGGGGAGAGGADGGAGVACPLSETVAADGSCQPVGVPPERCAAGFEPDGEMGCRAVLPQGPCAPGQLAVPGETSCHPLAPCGSPPWGEIPLDPAALYVDASYPGQDSDGSVEKPWTSLGEATAAAVPGGMVAIAAGSYAEDVIVTKPLRLWGRCPELVEIQGSAQALAALNLFPGSDGLEVHQLAVTGGAAGVLVYGAVGVLLDRLWVHDTAEEGVAVWEGKQQAGVTMRGSLVEGAHRTGVGAIGAELKVEASAVRDVVPVFGGEYARGLEAEQGDAAAVLTAVGSLVERVRGVGVRAASAEADVDATVVRGGEAYQDNRGWGVLAERLDGVTPASLSLRRSVVQGNVETAVVISVSAAIIEDTTIGDTQVGVQGAWGWGLSVESDLGSGARSDVEVLRSRVHANREAGVFCGGSDLRVKKSAIGGTLPSSEDLYGDGIAVGSARDEPERATVWVEQSWVGDNARAGISAFGAVVSLGHSTLACNQLGLDGEQQYFVFDIPYAFTDRGGNRCGCGQQLGTCQVVSTSLEPPPPM